MHGCHGAAAHARRPEPALNDRRVAFLEESSESPLQLHRSVLPRVVDTHERGVLLARSVRTGDRVDRDLERVLGRDRRDPSPGPGPSVADNLYPAPVRLHQLVDMRHLVLLKEQAAGLRLAPLDGGVPIHPGDESDQPF